MKEVILKNECRCSIGRKNSTTNSNSQIMKFLQDLINSTCLQKTWVKFAYVCTPCSSGRVVYPGLTADFIGSSVSTNTSGTLISLQMNSGKSLVLLHRDLSSSSLTFGSSAAADVVAAAQGRSSKDVLSHQDEEQEINGISKRQGAKHCAALQLENKRLLTSQDGHCRSRKLWKKFSSSVCTLRQSLAHLNVQAWSQTSDVTRIRDLAQHTQLEQG